MKYMEYADEICNLLSGAITSDYARSLVTEEFYDEVMQDVFETSAYEEDGYFNETEFKTKHFFILYGYFLILDLFLGMCFYCTMLHLI